MYRERSNSASPGFILYSRDGPPAIRKGVRQANRNWFTTAFYDGSVRIIDNQTSDKTLRAYLTHAGGEAIQGGRVLE